MLGRMEQPASATRSTELISAADSGLLVIDVQEKVIRLVPDRQRIIWNVGRLIDGAKLFKVPVLASEQYPKGLGATVPELAARLDGTNETLPSKTTFSCLACPPAAEAIKRPEVGKWLVAGIETHVCVQQTVLDLLAAGYRVYVAVDAVGSRNAIDHETALRRMESSGATLTTTESALFEWCGDSSRPEFKRISELIRETSPQ